MQARLHRRLRISLPISNIELKPESARRFCLLCISLPMSNIELKRAGGGFLG